MRDSQAVKTVGAVFTGYFFDAAYFGEKREVAVYSPQADIPAPPCKWRPLSDDRDGTSHIAEWPPADDFFSLERSC